MTSQTMMTAAYREQSQFTQSLDSDLRRGLSESQGQDRTAWHVSVVGFVQAVRAAFSRTPAKL